MGFHSSFRGSPPAAVVSTIFPLRISANGRYLTQVNGAPFLLCGDTPWTREVNLTRSQDATYTADRSNRNINATLFECIEHHFNDQANKYRNTEGNDPFTVMSPVNWVMNDAYWQLVDALYANCLRLGIVCMMNPAYLGFSGTQEGWSAEVSATADATLFAYGQAVSTRYPFALWCMYGDTHGDATSQGKMTQIANGIVSSNPRAIISAHLARSETMIGTIGQPSWFTLNGIYLANTGEADAQAATEYARSGPLPLITIEDGYEAASTVTLAMNRRSVYTSYLSGCCGHFTSHALLWSFGDAAGSDGLGAAHALATYLNTTGTQQRTIAYTLMGSMAWWKGVPSTGSSVITSSLGTSGTAGRLCPFFIANNASGRDAALVWKNDTNSITLNRAGFQQGAITVKWFDPTNGVYSTPAEGGSFSNVGTQAFAHPGNNSGGDPDWVLVMS